MSSIAVFRRSAWALAISLSALCAAPAAAQVVFANGYDGTPCSTSAWSQVLGNGAAGGPNDATPIARYAGNCAFRTTGAGFTQDDTPNNEATYRARFYVRPEVSAGSVFVFEALDGTGTPQVALAYNGLASEFQLHVRGSPDVNVSAPPGFWYFVELATQAGSVVGTTIRGAGGQVATAEMPSAFSTSAGIDRVRIGWVANLSGAPVGLVTVDDFVSTNSLVPPIGPLCRGDASGNGVLDQPDYRAVSDEILARGLAPGAPDCNEDARIDAIDRVCIAKRIGGACP